MMSAAVDRKNYPTLNPDRMPECTQYETAKATFKAVRQYFDQPGVQERFEAWQAEQERRKVENPESFQSAKGDCPINPTD